MRKTIDKRDITTELIEDASRELNDIVRRFNTELFEIIKPAQLFQEKHTTGYLWWKKTRYVYYKYFEGHMIAVSTYSAGTIKSLEK